EQFPGLSPVDVLKSAPGVLSGESRSSGGVDANIRGMQGQGRVVVTVDGTLNSSTVYRGYQGVGNRTFIDKDFLGGVSIEKGPATGGGVGGIGGTVAMTTINVDDILAEGETVGLRFKTSLNGNTAAPVDGVYRTTLLGDDNGRRVATGRPDALQMTAGSVSAVFAARSDRFDILAGVSHRRSGDYYVGEEGSAAPTSGSPSAYCVRYPAYCTDVLQWYSGPGLTRFVGGERVLNTSQDTYSALAKATLRLGADHALEFSASKYRSRFGENYPASVYRNTTTIGTSALSSTDLERYALRYVWSPDSDLLSVKANVWATNMVEASQALGGYTSAPKFVNMRGADVANTSKFGAGLGGVVAEYGAGYLFEETGPEGGAWDGVPGRQGSREETSVFGRASWTPLNWLRLDSNLRYAWSDYEDELAYAGDKDRAYDGGSFGLGATVEPVKGLQLFTSYKDAVRLPSLLEVTRGFILSSDPDLRPERTRNWEAGVNYVRKGLVRRNDSLGAKLVYFDNDITNYISRKYNTATYSMLIFNIDKARFAGWEASATYALGGFTAEVAATRYTDAAFCRKDEPCKKSSLAADYATNQIPPGFAASATATQKLFADRLSVTGRVNYVGERVVPYEATGSGASPFIAAIPWKRYSTADLYASWRVSRSLKLETSVENVTDVYYVEPLSLGLVPAPGRTVRLGLTAALGAGGGELPFWSPKRSRAVEAYDWTGFHAGVHGGYANGTPMAEDMSVLVDGYPLEQGDYRLGKGEGALGGLQAGYDWQFNDLFVVGVEGTYDWLDQKTSTQPYANLVLSVRAKNLASARLRAGVTRGRWLAYAAGGWAKADVSFDMVRYEMPFGGSGSAEGPMMAVGAEYAFSPIASLRLEYAYHDLKAKKAMGGTWSAYDLLFDGSATPRWRSDQATFGFNLRF
ncbi:MAG: TonB-dependent receptor, partial [Caulobacter sp.]